MKKWLYIPIETKVRELDAKILLACAAAQKDFNIIIARKAELSRYISILPPGIFLAYGGQENFAPFYKRLTEYGHTVIGMDEEGLVRFHDIKYCALKLSQKSLQYMRMFLSWGKDHGKVIQNFTRDSSNLEVCDVGNLRFDLLRAELRGKIDEQAQNLKKEHGKIILINSNMGAHNHYLGREKYFASLKTKKVILNSEDERFYGTWLDLQKNLYESYIDVLPELSRAFPEHIIVIRPHPSEDKSRWESISKNLDNVKVIYEGNVHPWITAADVLIHGFCTTPLEGFALDTPLIAYRPFKNNDIENEIPFLGSYEATTATELIKAIQTILGHNYKMADKSLLKPYIQNINGTYAYENILNTIEPHASRQVKTLPYLKLRYRYFRHVVTTIVNRLFNKRTKNEDYTDHKFPDFTKDDIRNGEQNLQKIFTDYKEVSITKIDPFCYMISSGHN